MQCRYCREEIDDKAVKCRFCNEFLTYRKKIFASLLSFLSILVPIVSLAFAGLQLWEKRTVEAEKRVVEEERNRYESETILQTEFIRENVTRNEISGALEKEPEEVRASAWKSPVELRREMEIAPENPVLQKALMYSKVLQER